MIMKTSAKLLLNLVTVAILSSGFAQFAFAGPIDTAYLIEADDRSASLDRIEVLLAQDAVAEQLQKFGVDEAAVVERLQNMTAAELVALEGQLEEGIAGGSAGRQVRSGNETDAYASFYRCLGRTVAWLRRSPEFWL